MTTSDWQGLALRSVAMLCLLANSAGAVSTTLLDTAQTMLMGDMVLLDDQASAAMDAALQNGLDVTALHNHFLWDAPKVMFMHVGGMGETEALAAAIGKVLSAIEGTSGGKGRVPALAIDPAATTLDPSIIDGVLGVKGGLAAGSTRSASVGRPLCTGTRSTVPWASTPGPPSPAAMRTRSSTATSPCARPSCSRC